MLGITLTKYPHNRRTKLDGPRMRHGWCYDPDFIRKLEVIMYTCQNQPCRERWEASDLEFINEGQGYFFRCPLCGARNKVVETTVPGGPRVFEQERR